MLTDELLTYLFDGQSHILITPMATWLASSRRFTNFVTTFRDKIRKKLRTTQEQETLYDLRLELETAYLLLRERALSLVYEPQDCGQERCPDFAVTFTTSLIFMVEVTRLRTIQKITSGSTPSQQENSLKFSLAAENLADTICSKLKQLSPQRSNVLIIGVDIPYQSQSDLQAALLRVQQRVERNDSAFLQRYRFRDRADFFRYYHRLSEVLVRGSQWQADEAVVVWINPQTKHPLPSKVRNTLYHSHTI